LEATITFGVDGRVYFQDFPPELLAVAEGLCPDDPELTVRRPKSVATTRGQME
jgi:hypothetical protein